MKRAKTYAAVLMSASLATAVLAGCGSAPATSTQPTEEAAIEEVAQPSTEELAAEIKDAAAKVPASKSATVKVTSTLASTAASGEDGESAEGGEGATAEVTSTVKFDATGEGVKTSGTFSLLGKTAEYYTDGDSAVVALDGEVYAGTTEEFGIPASKGLAEYLKSAFGDITTIVDCATNIDVTRMDDATLYFLTLDPQKYTDSDEAIKKLADAGDPVEDAVMIVGFDLAGRINFLSKDVTYKDHTASDLIDVSDFDSTTVDAAPAATKTFADLPTA